MELIGERQDAKKCSLNHDGRKIDMDRSKGVPLPDLVVLIAKFILA